MKFNSVPISQSRETCRRLNALMKLIKLNNNKKSKLKTKPIHKSRHANRNANVSPTPEQVAIVADRSPADHQKAITQNMEVANGNNQAIEEPNVDLENSEKLERRLPQKKAEQLKEEIEDLVPLNEQPGDQKPAWYFSEKKFRDHSLSEPTFKALEKNNFEFMTHIQARTLPLLLKGKDVLGSAKTGSGKTLAYLIPCIQKLRELDFRQKNGTGVIIITPTRELAIQVFDVAKKITEFHNKTIGLLIGGMNRKMQSNRLEKGVNLLICTPGRLLDHLQNSKFIYHNMFALVIDEADALLRIGFEQQLADILKVLPKHRQTILFSATQTRKIEDLAKLSLTNPVYIGVDDFNQTATVQSLQQGFVVINAANKFRLLLTFLKMQKANHKKVMVFFSSCNSVKYHSDLLNFIDISVMDIHGKQKQQKRSTTFYEFNQMKDGILLCTDVAARGLDIPEVDWIVQYDPPLDIREYIHRVGRTCRGHNSKGKALLMLVEQERSYLSHLLQSKVELNEYEFEEQRLQNIQDDYQLLIQKNNYLHGEAVQAFKSYLHAYTTYNLKDVFNVFNLDLKAVGRSFGLKKIPHVDLNVKLGGSKTKQLLKGQKNRK